MQDNVLKKEFKPEDVQRVRNLVQGKYGDKVTEGVGYSKKEEFHKEGDIWEMDGRKWTIKDGIKQNITKLDKAKKLNIMPIFCPNCSTQMKQRFDKDYYNISKKQVYSKNTRKILLTQILMVLSKISNFT